MYVTNEITFEQLPRAVGQLIDKLNTIERLLLKPPTAQPEGDTLLNIQQAAEVLCLSVPTIYGLVHKAEIPSCKRGKRLYFSKQELIKWIMDGRKKTRSEISAEADKHIASSNTKRRG
jgi:excisionase family DNA binding protein